MFFVQFPSGHHPAPMKNNAEIFGTLMQLWFGVISVHFHSFPCIGMYDYAELSCYHKWFTTCRDGSYLWIHYRGQHCQFVFGAFILLNSLLLSVTTMVQYSTPPFMMTSSNGNIFRVTGPLCGEFPAKRPVTRSFDVSFDVHLNTRLCKQWWGWWFEKPSRPLWRNRNVVLKTARSHILHN